MEKFYIALTENNGYHWVTFQARPDQATAEQTGFLAVGLGFDTQEEAEAIARMLNYSMFGLE